MTNQEKQQLKALFVATALYYGYELPDPALALYVEDLADLAFADVASALRQIRRDPKAARCPLPAQIRGRIEPSAEPASEAIVLANMIAGAIARIGPYQRPELPPAAMEVIRLEGGWEQVCEMATNDNLTTLKAQWRELARSLIETKRVPSVPRRETLTDQTSDIGKLLSCLKPMPIEAERAAL